MFNLILYRIGHFLAMHLPLRCSYLIASLLSNLQYSLYKKDRISVTHNLKAIFPKENNTTIKRYCRRVFINFGKYLVDFFRFSKIDKQYLDEFVTTQGQENLDNALSKGKGVITLTAHIGNWELGGVVMKALGYPVTIVALPHKYQRVNNFFNRQREIKGINVIPLGRAGRQCLESLRNNNILGLAGDREFGSGGTILEFFGRNSYVPKGPAVLSLKTGAPIIAGFMIREKNDHFTLVLEKPIEFTPSYDEGEDIILLMKKYLSIIEDYIRKYPDQWFMFREFWINDSLTK